MTYIPVSRQLISHEESVALELESIISGYLWRRWLAEFMADWKLTLPSDDSHHNLRENEFRREYLGTPMELDARVFDRALIRERMHPTKPIRVEVSEMSLRYFNNKLPHV